MSHSIPYPTCIDCGKTLSARHAKRCRSCYDKSRASNPLPATKRCRVCGIEKPVTEKYFHRDGRWFKNKCRECTREYLGAQSYRFDPYEGLPEGYKRCRKCKQVFVASEGFHVNTLTKDGRGCWCKECSRLKTQKWREDNPERTKASMQSWKETHLKNWRLRNIERIRFRGRIHTGHRRARILNLPNEFTTEDWQRALDYFGGCCAVCGRPPGLWHRLAMDHWIPITSPDCPGTIASNIIPLCHGDNGCNNSKNNHDPSKWLVKKVGKQKANQILKRIQDYFDSLT